MLRGCLDLLVAAPHNCPLEAFVFIHQLPVRKEVVGEPCTGEGNRLADVYERVALWYLLRLMPGTAAF
jgi:hypothetical protein